MKDAEISGIENEQESLSQPECSFSADENMNVSINTIGEKVSPQ